MTEFRADMLTLYGIIGGMGDSEALYEFAEAALRGGVTMLQLREKDISEAEYTARAIRLSGICRRFGVPLIINDSADVALESGADGVHVGAGDESVQGIRGRAPGRFIIGSTAKTPEQAAAAERQGADYIGVGAVFPSPTKRGATRITPEALGTICSGVSIPAAAIGGINSDNIMQLRGCGIRGAAVVSAIFGKTNADEVFAAASELKSRVMAVIAADGDGAHALRSDFRP